MDDFTVNDLLSKVMGLPGDQRLQFYTHTNTLVRYPCGNAKDILFSAMSQADSGE